jgi:hypothetical protein
MDLEQRYKIILLKEQELNKREKELNQREKDLKIGLAFMNGNVKYLNENYHDYDIDPKHSRDD